MRVGRRITGRWIVLSLVVAAAVVLAFVLSVRPSTRPGPPVLLVRIVDFVNATSPVGADFGPHCTAFAWDGRDRVLEAQAGVALDGVTGALLHRFVADPERIMWGGGDGVRTALLRQAVAWDLVSPIDGRTLAVLSVSGDNVTFGGTSHGPGDTWTASFAYDVPTHSGVASITESLGFANEGIVPTHIVPSQPCG